MNTSESRELVTNQSNEDLQVNNYTDDKIETDTVRLVH